MYHGRTNSLIPVLYGYTNDNDDGDEKDEDYEDNDVVHACAIYGRIKD